MLMRLNRAFKLPIIGVQRMSTIFTPGPWTVEVHEKHTSVESKHFTITSDVSNNDADLIAAAPELYEALARIIKSAPLTGLPLALETDIQAASVIFSKIGRNHHARNS